jgi:hypothetical protein
MGISIGSVSYVTFLTSGQKRITSDFFSQKQLDNHPLTFAGQTIGKKDKEKNARIADWRLLTG